MLLYTYEVRSPPARSARNVRSVQDIRKELKMRKHIVYLVCNSADIVIFTSHRKDLAFEHFR